MHICLINKGDIILNENKKKYINKRIQEIIKFCENLNYRAKVLNFEESTIPTLIISIAKDNNGRDIAVTCNVISVNLEDTLTLFIQFYICVSNVISKDKIEEVNEFIKRQNEHFMIGNLMNYKDCVCLKNAIYVNPIKGVSEEEFARSLDIFIYQASIMSEKISLIVKGEKSINEAISDGSFLV